MSSALLCIGHDPLLLRTRKWLLEPYFRVETALGVAKAAELLRLRSFAVVLLCSTLTKRECEIAIEMVREGYPGIKLLAINSGARVYHVAGADEEFIAEEGPGALIQKTLALAGGGRPDGDPLDASLGG